MLVMFDAPPPRFWWLKRVSACVVIVLALWAGGHALLWQVAQGGLEAHVERWRIDGGPLPEQAVLQPQMPDDPGNAAAWVVKAAGLMPRLSQPQVDNWNAAIVVRPLSGAQLEAMRSVMEQDRSAVEALREAYDKPYIDWGIPAARIETVLPSLADHRHVADRLQAAAEVHHHDGDIAQALARAEDVVFLGDMMAEYGPVLVGSLVSVGIQTKGSQLVVKYVAGTPVPGISPEEEHAAWRDARPEAQRLIARLLDTRSEQTLLRNGVLGERTVIYWAFDAPGGWSLVDANFFTRPFLMI